MPRRTPSISRAPRRAGDRLELLRLLAGMGGVTFVTLVLLVVQLQVDAVDLRPPPAAGWTESTGL